MGAKLERLIVGFGVAFIIAIFTLTAIQVILRYGFGTTFFFTEELARYFLVWATLAGTAVETRRNGHIRIPIILAHLPEGIRRIWIRLLDLFVLAVFILLAWLGVKSMIFNHGQESSGMQIPLSIPFAAIPLFFALSAVFVVEGLRRRQREP